MAGVNGDKEPSVQRGCPAASHKGFTSLTPDTVPQPEPAGPSREEAARGSELGPALRLPGCPTGQGHKALACAVCLKRLPGQQGLPAVNRGRMARLREFIIQSLAPASTVILVEWSRVLMSTEGTLSSGSAHLGCVELPGLGAEVYTSTRGLAHIDLYMQRK